MKKMKTKIDKIVIALALVLMSILLLVLYPKPTHTKHIDFRRWHYDSQFPHRFREKPDIQLLPDIRMKMQLQQVEYVRVVLYDEYRFFITAYCAEECGWSYSTSSGAICHRASWDYRYSEPTTCAIDRSYFGYDTLIYIPSEDRVYIAEDTGPGVRGYWIDTYQDDMSDVYGYNTRYETCYTCDLEYYSIGRYLFKMKSEICNDLVMLAY